jgi:hypothetical protein
VEKAKMKYKKTLLNALIKDNIAFPKALTKAIEHALNCDKGNFTAVEKQWLYTAHECLNP